jgi:hypothetical protein
VVLQDLCGLPSEKQLDTSLWAARARTRAALDNATAPFALMPTCKPLVRAAGVHLSSGAEQSTRIR